MARALAAAPAGLPVRRLLLGARLQPTRCPRARRRCRAWAAGSTVILVAQRISTVLACRPHRGARRGPRRRPWAPTDELMETCAAYREIALSQLTEEELADPIPVGGDLGRPSSSEIDPLGEGEPRFAPTEGKTGRRGCRRGCAMSGHPSVIPKGGGHGRGPGGHGHGPGGHGPAARMMARREAAGLQGPTMRQHALLHGPASRAGFCSCSCSPWPPPSFTIVGPKVLSEATTVLFDGARGQAAAGTGGDRLRRHRPHPAGDAGPVPAVGGVLVRAGLGHELHLAADVLPAARRHRRKRSTACPSATSRSTSTGDTLSRITNDVDTLGQSLNQGVTQAITSAVTVVGVLVMMLSINWIMTLVALVMVPVSMALVAVVVRRSQKHFVAQQRLLGAHERPAWRRRSRATPSCAPSGGRTRPCAPFEADNEALYNAGWKAQFLSGLMMPVLGLRGESGLRGRRRHRRRSSPWRAPSPWATSRPSSST